jgi:hypothetical protein
MSSKKDNNKDKNVDKEVIFESIDPQTEDIIRDALKTFVKERYNKRATNNDIEAMVATCSEFMKCFVIMGYDFKGNSIKPIFYANNDKDADALNQYIQKFIIQSLH